MNPETCKHSRQRRPWDICPDCGWKIGEAAMEAEAKRRCPDYRITKEGSRLVARWTKYGARRGLSVEAPTPTNNARENLLLACLDAMARV